MKKSFFYAICVMALATMVAMVSCKKDEQTKPTDNPTRPAKEFCPPSVSDMNAYLGDFKSKMRNPERDDNTMLSLEEAAWHLSSVANYDFANANVEFTDIRFDTLYGHVNVTDGEVSMADLGAAYAEMSAAIDGFYHSLDLDNKHFRFIGAEISENGSIAMSLVTTHTANTRWHFFSSAEEANTAYQYFPNDCYPALTEARVALTNAFNQVIGKSTNPGSGRIYYVVTSVQEFSWRDYFEEPGAYCPNSMGYRIFCTHAYFNTCIPRADMVYYLDSYLGLAMDHEFVFQGEVISCFVDKWTGGMLSNPREPQVGAHRPRVSYGLAVTGNDNGY